MWMISQCGEICQIRSEAVAAAGGGRERVRERERKENWGYFVYFYWDNIGWSGLNTTTSSHQNRSGQDRTEQVLEIHCWWWGTTGQAPIGQFSSDCVVFTLPHTLQFFEAITTTTSPASAPFLCILVVAGWSIPRFVGLFFFFFLHSLSSLNSIGQIDHTTQHSRAQSQIGAFHSQLILFSELLFSHSTAQHSTAISRRRSFANSS